MVPARNQMPPKYNDFILFVFLQKEMPNFEWSQELQGLILSSFYIGYVAIHMPGGRMAEKYGGKPVVMTALICSSILSLLTPVVVIFGGAHSLMGIRILLGCVQAGLYPAIATLLAAWIPQVERGRVGSVIYCAGPVRAFIIPLTKLILFPGFRNDSSFSDP